MSTAAGTRRTAWRRGELAWLCWLLTCALSCGLATAGLAQGTTGAVATAVELAGRADEITDDLAPALGEYAEPALAEYRSFARVIGYLSKAGFDLETGVGGVPTALVASAGDGRPVIGLRAALNADDVSGHSLGHNLEAAAAISAAIALKESLRELGLRGTVKLFLYPADARFDVGRSLAAAGALSGLDALIAARAGTENRGDRLSCDALRAAGYSSVSETDDEPTDSSEWIAQSVVTTGFTFSAWTPGTIPGSPAAAAQSATVDGAEKAWSAAKALSALGMRLLTDPAALGTLKAAFRPSSATLPQSIPGTPLSPAAFPEAPGITVRSDGLVRIVARVSSDQDYVIVPEPLVKVVLGAFDCGV